MRIDDCFQLGHIVKTFGVKGELVFFLDTDSPKHYQKMESVFVELNHQLIPFFIEKCTVKGSQAIVKIEDIDTPEQAAELKDAPVYLPLTSLPQLTEKQYYFHELKGYQVVDELLGPLGVIEDVVEAPQQSIVTMIFKEKEVLFPLADAFFVKIDRAQRLFHVKLPEGLLEIYLEQK